VTGLALAAACGGGDAAAPDADRTPPPPSEDWSRDVTDTDLRFAVSSRRGDATLTLAPSASTGASFEVGTLEISSVELADGTPLQFAVADGQLDVGVPAGDAPAEVRVRYAFSYVDGFMGADDMPWLTLTWPYYCGNLFPCKTRQDTTDGTRFTLALDEVPEGLTAVYPAEIPADAPAYMLAWTIDEYTELPLGTTGAGTEVAAWHLPNGGTSAAAGTVHLAGVVDWMEQVLGPYPYGGKVGSVSVRWGGGAYGGMEHHPYWHVASSAMSDQEVHAHEAAHGWFGNGVRLRCWEDFVLSEGTATYLAARSLQVVGGAAVGDALWADYETRLTALVNAGGGGVAWPASCGEVDILELFSDTPYTKGAFFLRAVADRIGVEQLDAALGAFFVAHAGRAAGMQDLLDTLEARSGWDPTACADKWLRAAAVPADRACP
jgi:hypothetical protein